VGELLPLFAIPRPDHTVVDGVRYAIPEWMDPAIIPGLPAFIRRSLQREARGTRAVRRRRPGRPGWEDLSLRPGKTAIHRRHVSGWEVVHCGHPTAIWSYQVLSPPGVERAPSGQTFRTLAEAMSAVEGVACDAA